MAIPMKFSIDAYLRAYIDYGSTAVWTLVSTACVTDDERQKEVDAIEKAGWFVLRHFSSHSADRQLDGAAFQPGG
jgi:hypothetical protein